MLIRTTRPKTTTDVPKSSVPCSTHSMATGERATRGGVTRQLGSRSRPTSANSSRSEGKSVAVALICSKSGSGARLTTNSPVAFAFASESLRPIDVNCTIGGSAQETVKNECGARLSTPAAERVETQAIGRGTTTELSRR